MRNLFLFIAITIVGFINAQEVVHTSEAGYDVIKKEEYIYVLDFKDHQEGDTEEFFRTAFIRNEEELQHLIVTIDNIIKEYADAKLQGRKAAKAKTIGSAHSGLNFVTRYRTHLTVNPNMTKIKQAKSSTNMRKAMLDFVAWYASRANVTIINNYN